jgi:hypothetical protein
LIKWSRSSETVSEWLDEAHTYVVPGFQFAKILQDVLGKARRHRVLPPVTAAASPAPGDDSGGGQLPVAGSSVLDGSGDVWDGFANFGSISSDVDFFLAEQLFSNNSAMGSGEMLVSLDETT